MLWFGWKACRRLNTWSTPTSTIWAGCGTLRMGHRWKSWGHRGKKWATKGQGMRAVTGPAFRYSLSISVLAGPWSLLSPFLSSKIVCALDWFIVKLNPFCLKVLAIRQLITAVGVTTVTREERFGFLSPPRHLSLSPFLSPLYLPLLFPLITNTCFDALPHRNKCHKKKVTMNSNLGSK